MGAPINAYPIPDADWDLSEQKLWNGLNNEILGNPNFYPLTVKGAYVVGSIFLLAKSIAWLHRHQEGTAITFIPRYLLTASSIELLGRCVEGETNSGQPTLKPGLLWTFQVQSVSNLAVQTKKGNYTINDLIDMRNFSAHGQATSTRGSVARFKEPDEELLKIMLERLGDRTGNFWNEIINDKSYARKLAQAKIEPINSYRILHTWIEFNQLPHRAVKEIYSAILEN